MCLCSNLDSLAVGEHKISFAAYDENDQLSEWTDTYSFYVEDKTITLARPSLESNLYVYSDDVFDSVTYDFGNNIKLTVNVNGRSHSLTKEELDKVEGLVDGQNYVVKCTIKKGNIESQVSNPVTYSYSESYYNKSVNTYTNGQIFKFEEQLSSPTLKVKVNDKEYIVNIDISEINELDVIDILGSIIAQKIAKSSELLAAKDIKVSVMVLHDSYHYKEGQYSKEITLDQNQFNDFSMFLEICEHIDWSFDDDNLLLQWNTDDDDFLQMGFDGFVSFKAAKEDGSELKINDGVLEEEIGSIDCSGNEIIHLKVSYSRAGYTNSKVIDIEVPTKETIAINNLRIEDTQLRWYTTSSDYDYFEVEIKNSCKTVKCNTQNHYLNYEEFDLSGDLSITVYAIKNNLRIDDSKSLTIQLSRKTAPGNLRVSDGYVTLTEGQVLNVDGTNYYYNKNTSYNNVYIANATNIYSYYVGDNIYSIKSANTNYVIDRTSSFDYKIEEGKYLVLKDFDISKMIDSDYSVYLDDDNRFDLSKYYNNTNRTSLRISGTDISYLSPTEKNKIIRGDISFEVTPSVEINNDYQKATNNLLFETNSIYDGKYEIIIEKYDEETNEYIELKTETTSNKSYSLDSLETGKYKVYVGTIGNGYVVSGSKDYIKYVFNEEKVVESIEYERSDTYVYTRINFVDNDLDYSYILWYRPGAYLNSDTGIQYNDYYEINMRYAEKLQLQARNYNSDTLYKYLPSVNLTLQYKNYYTSQGEYCYDVEGYELGDVYYLYRSGYSYNYYYTIAAKYEKNDTIYDVTTAQTVTIKEAEGDNPAETIDFVSISVSGLDMNTVDYYKYYCNYSSSYTDITSIIVDKAETKIATYLNEVVKTTEDIYVWKYQKVTAEGEEVDEKWYDLTDDVKVEEIKTVRLDEDFEEYTATWFTDDSNGNDCKIKLYANGKAVVKYSSTSNDSYVIGLNSKNNIDGECQWGYVDEANNIIYFQIEDSKKIYQLDKTNNSISIYSPTVDVNDKSYSLNEKFATEFIDNLYGDSTDYELILEAQNFISELRKVSFKISNDYILKYYNDELSETLIVEINEQPISNPTTSNMENAKAITISYLTNDWNGGINSSYRTINYVIYLLSDGTYFFTRNQ